MQARVDIVKLQLFGALEISYKRCEERIEQSGMHETNSIAIRNAAYGDPIRFAAGFPIDLLDATLVQFAKFIENTQTLGFAARFTGALVGRLAALIAFNQRDRHVVYIRGIRQTGTDRVHRFASIIDDVQL